MSWIEGVSPITFPGLGIEWNPPQGIQIGNLSIQFYGILIATGIMLAILYACRRSKQFGLQEDDLIDGVLCIVPFAVLCARLYYCAFEWEHYKNDLGSIFAIWNGGLAIYGGVIGAAIGIVVYAWVKRKKVKLTTVLDITSLGFLIGQSLGRWGNFFNREAYGAETESFLRMGLMLDENRVYSPVMRYWHPTFLYESLWNLGGFVLLHFLSKKRKYDGQIALGYVAWYGLGRTIIEGLRTDSLYWGPVRVSQLLAAASCFVAVVILVIMMFKRHDPKKLFVNVVAAREIAVAEETTDAEADLHTDEEPCDPWDEVTVAEENDNA